MSGAGKPTPGLSPVPLSDVTRRKAWLQEALAQHVVAPQDRSWFDKPVLSEAEGLTMSGAELGIGPLVLSLVLSLPKGLSKGEELFSEQISREAARPLLADWKWKRWYCQQDVSCGRCDTADELECFLLHGMLLE